MPKYEWICKECNIFWDREYRIGRAPDKTKCPTCKKLSHRYYQNNIPAVHFNCEGFPDNDRRLRGGAKKGSSDDNARELISSSERRMQTANQHYAPMHFNPKGWNEAAAKSDYERDRQSGFAPITPERKQEKQEQAKRQTAEVYNKHMSHKKTGPNDSRIKQQ
jgi:predicted nucleic acid-binding Zn ribbon protein